MNPLVLFLAAGAVLCAAFAIAFAVARGMENYGIVDVVWTYAFGAVGLFYAFAAGGWESRRLAVGTMALVWSIRLGTHLLLRVMRHHPVEDGRYQQLRIDWAEGFPRRMFGFFQLQAISVAVLALPFLLAARNPVPDWHPLEIAGAVLWLIALCGESLADAQLRAFKRLPRNRDRVCDAGLWGLSRHPNYFFEWLIWVAWLLFALPSPWGLLAVLSPAAMLYLLLRVTGIPLTEQQSIRSKGDAYRRYQQSTSAFFPWFSRRRS